MKIALYVKQNQFIAKGEILYTHTYFINWRLLIKWNIDIIILYYIIWYTDAIIRACSKPQN